MNHLGLLLKQVQDFNEGIRTGRAFGIKTPEMADEALADEKKRLESAGRDEAHENKQRYAD